MVDKWQKTWKDFVGKGFFGVWRLLNGARRRYLHGFVRLPDTKPCKLRRFWAVYASKWPQNTVNTSVFSSSSLQEWPQTTLFIYMFFVAQVFFSVWRLTSDSLLPFVHPLLSQVLIRLHIWKDESCADFLHA